MSNHRKIVFFGLFGGTNIGNDASLTSVHQAFQSASPDARFACISCGPEAVLQSHGLDGILIERSPTGHWRRLRPAALRLLSRILFWLPAECVGFFRIWRYLRDTKAIVFPGTGILDDFGLSPFGLPYELLKWTLVARLRRIPLVYVCIGAGPLTHPVSRLLMTSAARLATFRSFRDEYSRNYLSASGIDTSRDEIRPDVVFRLAVPRHSPRKAPSEGDLVVGLGIMTYLGWTDLAADGEPIYRDYLRKMETFLRYLLSRGHSVRLLVGQASDDRARVDIMSAVQASDFANGRGSISAPEISSFDSLVEQIAGCDVVVATRFHNVVGALMAGVPVISLGYATKNDELVAHFGLDRYAQHVESFDEERLIADFEHIVPRLAEYGSIVSSTADAHRQALEDHLRRVAALYL
jgi:polysaccharide pyruvyl transferase WcaK-like protein